MIALFIDTSTSFPTISIIEDNKILFNFCEEIKNDMSSKILPIIDSGLKKNNIKLEAVDKLFVVTGPGSFTGVRIGVTIAKTIAWALNKTIISVSSLEYMATTNTDKKYLVPMIDARRGNVFGGIYTTDLDCVKKDSLIGINKLVEVTKEDYEFISYDNLENAIKPSPNVIKIIIKHINDIGINPHELKPNYLKLTEAEENRLKND